MSARKTEGERCREDLANWGRWNSQDDTDAALGYKASSIFRDYRPGKVWDDPAPARLPVDSLAAERAERIVMCMGRLARTCLIQRYIHRQNTAGIARILHTSRPSVVKLLEAAEREFWRARCAPRNAILVKGSFVA